MDESVFKAFCAEIRKLSVAQPRSLSQLLRTIGARTEVLAKIDARGEQIDVCLYCPETAIRRWGRTRSGLQRLRCLGCKRTLPTATGTRLERMRHPEKFAQVIEYMLSRAPN